MQGHAVLEVYLEHSLGRLSTSIAHANGAIKRNVMLGFDNLMLHHFPADIELYLSINHSFVIFVTPHDHNYFDYIIECSDKLYYHSVINDFDRRIAQHCE